jgi:hypothetical protein
MGEQAKPTELAHGGVALAPAASSGREKFYGQILIQQRDERETSTGAERRRRMPKGKLVKH